MTTNTENENHYSNTYSTYQNGGEYKSHGNVEVRRGSHFPPEQDNAHVSEVKKRYVMQEDGTVVEVDPNQDF